MKGNDKDCICANQGKHSKRCDAFRLSEFMKRGAVGTMTPNTQHTMEERLRKEWIDHKWMELVHSDELNKDADWWLSHVSQAIEKARMEERQRIQKVLEEYAAKGFDIHTAAYSACVPELLTLIKEA